MIFLPTWVRGKGGADVSWFGRRLPVVWFAHNHIFWLRWGQLWSLGAPRCWLCLELFDLIAIFPRVPASM